MSSWVASTDLPLAVEKKVKLYLLFEENLRLNENYIVPNALQIAMSSIRAISGNTIIPLPRLLHICTNVTVELSSPLTYPKDGNCTDGIPLGIDPTQKKKSISYTLKIQIIIIFFSLKTYQSNEMDSCPMENYKQPIHKSPPTMHFSTYQSTIKLY